MSKPGVLNYIKLASLGQDAINAFEDARGTKAPFFLHRRFIAAIVLLGSGALDAFLDVKVQDAEGLTDMILEIGLKTSEFYGIAMMIWGQIKAKKRKEGKE